MEKNTKCGAGWIRKDKNGHSYLSLSITIDGKENIIFLFRNTRKENEKQPDYSAMLIDSKVKDQSSAVKSKFHGEDIPF